jgi:hypothetical protein
MVLDADLARVLSLIEAFSVRAFYAMINRGARESILREV